MRLLIYGSRSFASTVADLARNCGHEVLGMIDDVETWLGIVGSFVMAGATVDRAVSLGQIVVAWPGACINLEVDAGGNCFVSPNSTLRGFAQVGSHSFIGANAALVDHGEVTASSYVRMLESYTRKDPV